MPLGLDDVEIDFKCPKCGFSNKATLKQVRLGETIICSGCHENIKLIDKEASTQRAVDEIEKSFEDLEKTIEDINRRS
jgi:peptide subunit release factor 1 (eRF1)